ncbi:hypothetical protein CS062_05180 [Roseateles chitinivorans]|uniref:Uncharacterized protein n=1 Tax=Roseateles chitinivorans TaxID=2917965 RepID=A0A2G9CD03_9BURK|nr:hypothetical protein CS062_05180 [Roseateles chitinivorans]
MQQAADVLRDLGFDIVRTGRFAVSVRGQPQQFEAVLGVPAADLLGVSGPLTPRVPDLMGLVDYIEVLPPSRP